MSAVIGDAWRAYERDVVPREASVIQRMECRQAFYAGAAIMFKEMSEAADAGPQDGIARVSALGFECEMFADEVGKAREP